MGDLFGGSGPQNAANADQGVSNQMAQQLYNIASMVGQQYATNLGPLYNAQNQANQSNATLVPWASNSLTTANQIGNNASSDKTYLSNIANGNLSNLYNAGSTGIGNALGQVGSNTNYLTGVANGNLGNLYNRLGPVISNAQGTVDNNTSALTNTANNNLNLNMANIGAQGGNLQNWAIANQREGTDEARNNPALMQGQNAALGLGNFGAQQGGQIQALGNQMLQSGESDINTLMSRLGGVANPNALAEDLFRKNRQSADQATQEMQSQLAGQQLAATGTEISGLNQIGGTELSGILQALGLGQGGIGQSANLITQGSLGATGQQDNLLSSALGQQNQLGTSLAGLDLSSFLQGQGQQQALLGSAMGQQNQLSSQLNQNYIADLLSGMGLQQSGLQSASQLALNGQVAGNQSQMAATSQLAGLFQQPLANASSVFGTTTTPIGGAMGNLGNLSAQYGNMANANANAAANQQGAGMGALFSFIPALFGLG